MTVLSGKEIRKRLADGSLSIKGLEDSGIGSASVDIHLGDRITCFKYCASTFIDSRAMTDAAQHERLLKDGRKVIWHDYTDEFIGNEPFIIHPKDYVLGVSKEYVKMPQDLCAKFYGKSNLSKIGLITSCLGSWAGWLNQGFEGDFQIGMQNAAWLPIKVYPGMIIGELVFEEVR